MVLFEFWTWTDHYRDLLVVIHSFIPSLNCTLKVVMSFVANLMIDSSLRKQLISSIFPQAIPVLPYADESIRFHDD